MDTLFVASAVLDCGAVAGIGWLLRRSARERDAALGAERVALERLREDLAQLVSDARAEPRAAGPRRGEAPARPRAQRPGRGAEAGQRRAQDPERPCRYSGGEPAGRPGLER